MCMVEIEIQFVCCSCPWTPGTGSGLRCMDASAGYHLFNNNGIWVPDSNLFCKIVCNWPSPRWVGLCTALLYSCTHLWMLDFVMVAINASAKTGIDGLKLFITFWNSVSGLVSNLSSCHDSVQCLLPSVLWTRDAAKVWAAYFRDSVQCLLLCRELVTPPKFEHAVVMKSCHSFF